MRIAVTEMKFLWRPAAIVPAVQDWYGVSYALPAGPSRIPAISEDVLERSGWPQWPYQMVD
jgi:hypothetical protein